MSTYFTLCAGIFLGAGSWLQFAILGWKLLFSVGVFFCTILVSLKQQSIDINSINARYKIFYNKINWNKVKHFPSLSSLWTYNWKLIYFLLFFTFMLFHISLHCTIFILQKQPKWKHMDIFKRSNSEGQSQKAVSLHSFTTYNFLKRKRKKKRKKKKWNDSSIYILVRVSVHPTLIPSGSTEH